LVEGFTTLSNNVLIHGSTTLSNILLTHSNIVLKKGHLTIGDENFEDNGTLGNIKLNVDGSVRANEYYMSSDERIKTNLSKCSGEQACKILSEVDVKLFNKLPTTPMCEHGDKLQIGVIAQQLEHVLKQNGFDNTNIISKTKKYVPDLMMKTIGQDSGNKLKLTLDEKNNDKSDNIPLDVNVKIINMKNLETHITRLIWKEVDETKTNMYMSFDQMFVRKNEEYMLYGTEVDDFSSVDYIQLFCLLLKAFQDKCL